MPLAWLFMPDYPCPSVGRKPRKKERPPRLGPYGRGVRVAFTDHGDERFLERFAPKGFGKEDLAALVREPNTDRKDIVDPKNPHRIRRWIHLRAGDVPLLVRTVFEVPVPKSGTDPGEILVISVMVER